MGSFGSGRSGGRPLVEHALEWDIGQLVRERAIQPHMLVRSISTWRAGSAEYEVIAGADEGVLTITRLVRHDHFGREIEIPGHTIRLVTTRPPFGGLRWWFECPLSRALVAKLYLPQGARMFASRKAYRLGYRSQRQTATDRAYHRAYKAREKLGGSGNLVEPIPPKPHGMRWRTYDRLHAAAVKADRVTLANSIALLDRLSPHWREKRKRFW